MDLDAEGYMLDQGVCYDEPFNGLTQAREAVESEMLALQARGVKATFTRGDTIPER